MQAYCCLLPYGLMLLKYTSVQPYLHLICLLTHSCSIWCLSKAKRLYEQRCRDKDEAEQAVHRNANLVTQKQQEKVWRVGGCATWERSVSSHWFPIPSPSLSSGVRMAWVGCWPSLVGLLCCEWSTRALLYLSSLSHLWQLFLKLAQTKSALEDSGECGDTAYWFGGASRGMGGGRRKLSYRSSETIGNTYLGEAHVAPPYGPTILPVFSPDMTSVLLWHFASQWIVHCREPTITGFSPGPFSHFWLEKVPSSKKYISLINIYQLTIWFPS